MEETEFLFCLFLFFFLYAISFCPPDETLQNEDSDFIPRERRAVTQDVHVEVVALVDYKVYSE